MRGGQFLADGGQEGSQQGHHLLSFVEEEALVALGIGQRQGFSQPLPGLRLALLGKVQESYEDQHLQVASRAPLLARLNLSALEQVERLVDLAVPTCNVPRVATLRLSRLERNSLLLCHDQAGNHELFLLLGQQWNALPMHGARDGPALDRSQIKSRQLESGLRDEDFPVEQRRRVRPPPPPERMQQG